MGVVWRTGGGGRGRGGGGGRGGSEHVTLSCNVCQYFLQHCKQLQESLGLEGMFFFNTFSAAKLALVQNTKAIVHYKNR